MKPLSEFPEIPEGLEREVYELYESTVEGHDRTAHSTHFTKQVDTGAIDIKDPRVLDLLVDWLYGTYETIKAVKSRGMEKPKAPLQWNVFQTAVAGGYNATGLVYSGLMLREYDDVMRWYNDLRGRVGIPFSVNSGEHAITALQEKLKFEAAMYERMKQSYGITVALPS